MRSALHWFDRRAPGLLAINVLSTAYLTLAPAFVGAFVERLHLQAAQAGLVTSAQLMGAALGGALVLFGSVRAPDAALLRMSALLMGCADLLCSMLTSAGALIACRALAGAAAGVGFTTVNGVVGRSSRPTAIYGAMLTAQMIFGIAGYLSFPSLLDSIGLRGIFMVLGALAMFSVPLVTAAQAADRSQDANLVTRGIRGHLGMNFTLASLALLYVANSAVWTYLDRIGISAGLGTGVVSVALALCMVVGLCGAVLAALTSAFIRPATAMLTGVLLMATCTGLLCLSALPHVYTVAVAGFNGTLMFVVPFYLARLAEGPYSNRYIAVASMAIFLGLALGPMVGSRLLAENGYDRLIWTATAGLLGAAALVAAASWRRLHERAQERDEVAT